MFCALQIAYFQTDNEYLLTSDIERVVDFGKIYFFYVALLFDLYKW